MDGDVFVTSTLGEGSVFTLEIPVIAHEVKTFEMFNIEPFKKLTMALLRQDGKLSKTMLSLQRYLDIFELDVIFIDELTKDAYDLLFFSDAETSEALRSKIAAQMLPSVSIMDYFDNRYEHTENITPLYFPIYCSKLYHTFLESLHLSQENDASLLPDLPKKRLFKGNILVAEDNGANQELIRIILESYGLHYLIASDGQEAVMRFKSGSFDLVLMDEQMPRKSGSEATAEIRNFEKKHQRRPTPIVALTANVLKGEKEKSPLKGYDEFLGKPIVLKEMEAMLSHFLEERESSEVTGTLDVLTTTQEHPLGINVAKLAEELMLDEEQVVRLMAIYTKKMHESLEELKEVIAVRDYKVIGHLAHSIKGSSSNFRIESIVALAYELEKASYAEDDSFDFEAIYEAMLEAFTEVEEKA